MFHTTFYFGAKIFRPTEKSEMTWDIHFIRGKHFLVLSSRFFPRTETIISISCRKRGYIIVICTSTWISDFFCRNIPATSLEPLWLSLKSWTTKHGRFRLIYHLIDRSNAHVVVNISFSSLSEVCLLCGRSQYDKQVLLRCNNSKPMSLKRWNDLRCISVLVENFFFSEQEWTPPMHSYSWAIWISTS